MESFTSRRNADRFWVNLRERQQGSALEHEGSSGGFLLPGRLPQGGLDTPSYIFCIKLRAEHSPAGLVRTDLSLFLVRRLRSMPSMRFSKQRCIACCFSGGWLFTMLFLKSEKYCRRHEKAGLTSRGTASLALGHSRKEGGNVLQLFGWLLVPLKTQT